MGEEYIERVFGSQASSTPHSTQVCMLCGKVTFSILNHEKECEELWEPSQDATILKPSKNSDS